MFGLLFVFLVLVAPLVGGGIYFLTRGRAEEKASERARDQRRLLDMLMTRGQLSIVDVALESGRTREQIESDLYDLVGLGLFTGFVDWRKGVLHSVEAAQLAGATNLPQLRWRAGAGRQGPHHLPLLRRGDLPRPIWGARARACTGRRHLRGRTRPVSERPEELLEQRIREALDRIPGYRGYRLKEERRDADRRVRAAVADAYAAELARVERIGRDLANARRLGEIAAVERASQAIRHLHRPRALGHPRLRRHLWRPRHRRRRPRPAPPLRREVCSLGWTRCGPRSTGWSRRSPPESHSGQAAEIRRRHD